MLVLLKGKTWALCIHSFKKWKNEYRNPKEKPIIPYYKFFMDLPYGEYRLHGKTVTAKSHYFFPFAFRYFIEVNKETKNKEAININNDLKDTKLTNTLIHKERGE